MYGARFLASRMKAQPQQVRKTHKRRSSNTPVTSYITRAPEPTGVAPAPAPAPVPPRYSPYIVPNPEGFAIPGWVVTDDRVTEFLLNAYEIQVDNHSGQTGYLDYSAENNGNHVFRYFDPSKYPLVDLEPLYAAITTARVKENAERKAASYAKWRAKYDANHTCFGTLCGIVKDLFYGTTMYDGGKRRNTRKSLRYGRFK